VIQRYEEGQERMEEAIISGQYVLYDYMIYDPAARRSQDPGRILGDRITKNPKPDLKPNGKAAGADMHVAASAGSLTRSGLSVGRDLLSRVRLLLLGGRVRLESCSRSILVTGHVSADERPTLGETCAGTVV